MLDIGGDVGALVVTMPPELEGVEVEINRIDTAAEGLPARAVMITLILMIITIFMITTKNLIMSIYMIMQRTVRMWQSWLAQHRLV